MQINNFQHINSNQMLHKFQFFVLYSLCALSSWISISRALWGEQYHHFVWSLSSGDDNCNYFRSRLFSRRVVRVTLDGVCAVCLCGVITPAVAIWWKNRRRPWNTTWHWFSLHNSWPPQKKRFCDRALAPPHTHTYAFTPTLASVSIEQHKLMWKFHFIYSHSTPNLPILSSSPKFT